MPTRAPLSRHLALTTSLATATLLAACASTGPAAPLACNDGIKTAFKPDAQTTVVAVRLVKKGEAITAPDAPTPVTTAADMCLVKLLVGPGVTAEKDRNARSYSEGIGIEVWLPTHANWNQRIRNYGGGGWVGGGHRYADKIGSKVPAIINANMGYASGTTDAGQPWYQDGSFAFLSNGKVNTEALRDFSVRSMVEQAVKTKALVAAYYGQAPKFTYFDGHSQGGRQGMKIAQDHPELYDGYLIGQPALSIPQFGTAGLYTQIVLKTELGFTAADKDKAAAFAKKVEAVNKRAVASCDKEKLGFLLDPFACNYDPLKDTAALCTGAQGDASVAGTNADAATCMSAKEATALNKIWHGATRDGSWDAAASADSRSGKAGLAPKQLWWTFTKGSGIGGNIMGAGTDNVALAMQDVSYAADASTTRATPIQNASTPVRNRWMTLDYAGLAQAVDQNVALQPSLFANLATDNPDLSKLRSLGKKIIVHSGLAEDAIPPAGNIHYHERVAARMGGHDEVRKFMRMYLVPGAAHSSQGRAYTVGGTNNSVPLPKLPGNANQNPTREQDQFFTALVDWVEQGAAPETLVMTSRDGTVSLPACGYPKKVVWDGVGSAKVAGSYGCR
jgi:pimeloyl-ACP methyl ester carboxylesterase